MKLREIMTKQVVRINPEESVAVAARTLAHYNIGMLPVCDGRGQVCGLVTDRDLVTRCVAAGRNPAVTAVREGMTRNIISGMEDMDVSVAAHLMGREQIRRLPILENGKLTAWLAWGIWRSGNRQALTRGRRWRKSAKIFP